MGAALTASPFVMIFMSQFRKEAALTEKIFILASAHPITFYAMTTGKLNGMRIGRRLEMLWQELS